MQKEIKLEMFCDDDDDDDDDDVDGCIPFYFIQLSTSSTTISALLIVFQCLFDTIQFNSIQFDHSFTLQIPSFLHSVDLSSHLHLIIHSILFIGFFLYPASRSQCRSERFIGSTIERAH